MATGLASFDFSAVGRSGVEYRYEVTEAALDAYAAATGDVREGRSSPCFPRGRQFARQVGLPGRIVHGLCTMAFAGRAVLEAAGVDNPRAVRRIAVRFSVPLFPGESVTSVSGSSTAGSDSSR